MLEALHTKPSLGAIRAVTCVVPDLERVESAYTRFLDYRVVDDGIISQSVADGWSAPAMAEAAYFTMAPASGERVHLRFIESESAAGYRALTTHGWNATEFVVQDVDALASRLDDSPFQLIGEPKSLTRFPMIRAMQVIGPAGECLYFTQIGPGSGLDLAAAASFVGRVFIVVAGAADLSALLSTYSAFANEIDPPVRTPVAVISRANGLPLDTEHPHGLIKLPSGTLIELDGYPNVTTPRTVAEGELPPGMAMVSFDFGAIERYEPTCGCTQALLPHAGRCAVLRGAAGELIELVESVPAERSAMTTMRATE
jgi:hypothetical protein